MSTKEINTHPKRILFLANAKGGTGKSTAGLFLYYFLTSLNYKVEVICSRPNHGVLEKICHKEIHIENEEELMGMLDQIISSDKDIWIWELNATCLNGKTQKILCDFFTECKPQNIDGSLCLVINGTGTSIDGTLDFINGFNQLGKLCLIENKQNSNKQESKYYDKQIKLLKEVIENRVLKIPKLNKTQRVLLDDLDTYALANTIKTLVHNKYLCKHCSPKKWKKPVRKFYKSLMETRGWIVS